LACLRGMVFVKWKNSNMTRHLASPNPFSGEAENKSHAPKSARCPDRPAPTGNYTAFLHIRWGRPSPSHTLSLSSYTSYPPPLAISPSTSSSSPLPTPAAPLSPSSEFKPFARQSTHKATPAKSLFQLRVLPPPPATFPFRYSYYFSSPPPVAPFVSFGSLNCRATHSLVTHTNPTALHLCDFLKQCLASFSAKHRCSDIIRQDLRIYRV
jgi:hypothetical protein